MKSAKFFTLLIIPALLMGGIFCKKKGSEPAAGGTEATASANEVGKKTFNNVCTSCHGATGTGDGPAGASLNPKPRNFKEKFKFGDDLKSVTKTITDGSPDTPLMAAYKNVLKPEEIEAVAKYVLELKGK